MPRHRGRPYPRVLAPDVRKARAEQALIESKFKSAREEIERVLKDPIVIIVPAAQHYPSDVGRGFYADVVAAAITKAIADEHTGKDLAPQISENQIRPRNGSRIVYIGAFGNHAVDVTFPGNHSVPAQLVVAPSIERARWTSMVKVTERSLKRAYVIDPPNP